MFALAKDLTLRYADGFTSIEGDMAAALEAQARKRVAIRFAAERVASWDHRKLGGDVLSAGSVIPPGGGPPHSERPPPPPKRAARQKGHATNKKACASLHPPPKKRAHPKERGGGHTPPPPNGENPLNPHKKWGALERGETGPPRGAYKPHYPKTKAAPGGRRNG